MILHLSRKLADRLQCKLSFERENVTQAGRIDSWSADLFSPPGHGCFGFIMHDASLFPILVPLRAKTNYEAFLGDLLQHIECAYGNVGAEFDTANQTVLLTKRSNRSIIGSMNEAIWRLGFEATMAADMKRRIDWSKTVEYIGTMPFSAVKGHFPDKRFAELVGG